jgi:hypothetical protein
MMDIPFQDSSEIPLPPDEVRIQALSAEPYPDGRRVRITFVVTPFQKKPNAEILITNELGFQVASVNIIEAHDQKMELTMHLKEPEPEGKFTLSAVLFYIEEFPQADKDDVPVKSERFIVDEADTTFRI